MIDTTSITLANVGQINPASIDDYIERGGYQGLRKALQRPPADLITEVEASGLRGRGGAGYPTGLKERITRNACGDCEALYLVCNADEGEPGTFKDRIIMENDPHLLLEGMTIAAYIVGSRQGYLYVRGEYAESVQRLTEAIGVARREGFLGGAILGSDFAFDIEIRLGGGSYLCGEELTLLESLEGKRGYPRIKPPFPAEKGLWQKPTLVNNVETFCHLPAIMDKGAAWYRKLGTEKSTGTKLFCLSGRVTNPGIYEAAFGITLRELIDDLAGGMAPGHSFKGALLGGAAGTFADASILDVPIGYDTLKERGLTLGSGAVIVFSEQDSVRSILTSSLRFFKHESCGKCVPCRMGTHHLLEMMHAPGPLSPDALLDEARYMASTSLCPLGQSPILPIRSARQYFESELAS